MSLQTKLKLKYICTNNNSVLRLLRRVSAWRYLHLMLSAGACSTAPAACSHRSISSTHRGAQQQTRRLSSLLLIDGTDRRTDTRPLHWPSLTRMLYYTGSATDGALIHSVGYESYETVPFANVFHLSKHVPRPLQGSTTTLQIKLVMFCG